MSESKEAHKFRENLRYRLRTAHPDWTPEKVKAEISREMDRFKDGSKRGQNSSKKSSEVQKTGSEKSESKKNITGKSEGSEFRFKSSKGGSERNTRIWIKLDHSVDKSQYVLSESLDGLSWKYSATLTKGQPFERNGVIILPTWHKGSTKEGDAV